MSDDISSVEELFSIQVTDASVSAAHCHPEGAVATVVLAHGAGAGMDHPFLTGFASALNELKIATLRFNFPYVEAGKKFPDRPPVAIETWRAVMAVAAARTAGEPVFAAGKSFGGRMASMAAAEGMDCAGLIFLGYPLHAPGKPEKLRDEHLYGIEASMLFLQGSRDPFAQPGELEPVVERIGSNATLQWFEGGDHSFKVARSKRTPEQDGAWLADSVLEFVHAKA